MSAAADRDVTRLLEAWSGGDEDALAAVMPLIYDELHRMAKRYMRQQPSGHTLQTTELIHEAYLKLAGGKAKNWENRAHFFGVAAKAMRHILVNYARAKNSQKRGGVQERVTLGENLALVGQRPAEIVALDEALKHLAKLDERKSQVVELKYFGGLTHDEISEVLKISPETVNRDWKFSRMWLLRTLANQ